MNPQPGNLETKGFLPAYGTQTVLCQETQYYVEMYRPTFPVEVEFIANFHSIVGNWYKIAVKCTTVKDFWLDITIPIFLTNLAHGTCCGHVVYSKYGKLITCFPDGFHVTMTYQCKIDEFNLMVRHVNCEDFSFNTWFTGKQLRDFLNSNPTEKINSENQ